LTSEAPQQAGGRAVWWRVGEMMTGAEREAGGRVTEIGGEAIAAREIIRSGSGGNRRLRRAVVIHRTATIPTPRMIRKSGQARPTT
jgi:hypothetical protein